MKRCYDSGAVKRKMREHEVNELSKHYKESRWMLYKSQTVLCQLLLKVTSYYYQLLWHKSNALLLLVTFFYKSSLTSYITSRAVNIAIKYRNTWYRRYIFDVFSVSQRVSRQFHFCGIACVGLSPILFWPFSAILDTNTFSTLIYIISRPFQ